MLPVSISQVISVGKAVEVASPRPAGNWLLLSGGGSEGYARSVTKIRERKWVCCMGWVVCMGVLEWLAQHELRGIGGGCTGRKTYPCNLQLSLPASPLTFFHKAGSLCYHYHCFLAPWSHSVDLFSSINISITVMQQVTGCLSLSVYVWIYIQT